MFSLNLVAFYFSFHDIVVVLFNREFLNSSSDSIKFTSFILSDIEEQRVDYEPYE